MSEQEEVPKRVSESPHSKPGMVALDYRWIIIALLGVAIVVMFAMWRPWEAQYDKNARTVDVTGATTLKAEPDQITFYPQYQFQDTDKEAAVNAAGKKSAEVIKKLRELGVAEKAIKSETFGSSDSVMPMSSASSDGYSYTTSITITLADMKLAQKVQDYLVTTAPEGQITPQYDFATATRKKLEDSARDAATKDARKKAEQSAKNLGFSLGSVKSVTDGSLGGYPYATAMTDGGKDMAVSSYALQPGENELSYSVSVSFYIK